MKRLLLAILAMVLVTACNQPTNPLRENWVSMDCPALKVGDSVNINLTLMVVAEPKATCAEKKDTNGNPIATFEDGACIQCVSGYCMMWAKPPQEATDMTYGHELKHGFGCKHAQGP